MFTDKIYFKHTLIILAAIATAGFLLQWSINPLINLSFPFNLYVGLLLLVLILLLRIFASKTFIYHWLTSLFTSLAAILFFFFFIILMGIIPQKHSISFIDRLGLTSISTSIPFILVYLFLLINLGLVVTKRITNSWNKKNVAFILNHLGLWLVLLAGGLGSFDFIRLDMVCRMNSTVWYGYDENEKIYNLPFAVELKKFEIDYYLPKIKLVKKDSTAKNGMIVLKQAELDTIHTIKLGNYNINIKKYIPYSWWWNDSVFSMKAPGYIASAYVEVVSKDSSFNTWLAYPSRMQQGKMQEMKNGNIIILEAPIVKRYKSTITLYTQNEEKYTATIEVNKPLEVMGWKLYLKDYHKELGEYSDYIIIETNKDNWLNVVFGSNTINLDRKQKLI
ncbi:MAG: cytochrome c biogenesis protein ResB [Bacteroidales bacterium]|nr:cytochrome c biogenesis protein ResB [Bacteroidales bacterium]